MSRPLNVEQIVQRASDFDYNPLIPLKYWLRTAGMLLKEASTGILCKRHIVTDTTQAEIYEREGNDQQTYLLLFRHAQLVIRYLSGHPDTSQAQNKKPLQKAIQEVNGNIKKLEQLKPRINKRYERYEQLLRNREARRASTASVRSSEISNQRTSSPSSHRRLISDPAIATDAETLAAGENKDLAVELAHKEIRRRATARKATRQAGIPEEVEHERRTAGVWGNWEDALTNDGGLDRDTLSRQMQNVRSQVNGSGNDQARRVHYRPSFESSTRSDFSYPSVPEHHQSPGRLNATENPNAPQYQSQRIQATPQQAPPPPPKHRESHDFESPRAAPARPDKNPLIPDTRQTAKAGPGHQDLKPSALTFKPSAYLENGSPLRTIFLPPDLRHRFLDIAHPNTSANLETCGILCGTLISNALFISKLVIPDQKCTSDTCETINESELFDYVDGEDLMVLGWIHTHPTQTCFMSSRDLHTHGGYQVMMPESIAIVCAPSKGDWGVFRLTDPPGMKSILNCTQTGLFHPHAESNIYTDALRPGHVYEAKGLEFEVVDLRQSREAK